MTVLRSLLGSTADATAAEPVDPESPSDEALRDAFAEAIERTDEATVLGVVATDLVTLAHEDNREFTNRLRAMRDLAEPANPENPRDLDVIDAEAEAIKGAIKSFSDRLDLLAAEREAHADAAAERERLDAFPSLPTEWKRDASAYGEDLIKSAVRVRDYLAESGEATTDDLYRRYRAKIPHNIATRTAFEVRVVPVVADAAGVEYRGWRVDPDEALDGEAIDEAAAEPAFKHSYGDELLAAAYRALADAPDHGMARLALKRAASSRSNVAAGDAFFGPEDPDDLTRDRLHELAEGLKALLDLPGVEPPADEPAWRWVGDGGGESDG